jgi:hypothetical protein
MKIINARRAITSIVFGICVISATASEAGRLPLSYEALNHFQIDCSKAKEQTEFLISLKRSDDEMLADRIKAYVMPWKILTDPDGHARLNHSGYGGYNHMIRSILHEIATQCGSGPGYMW